MELFLVLLLLAGFTYILVRNSAKGLTTTPVWLLWLVIMIPAITWSVWFLVMGEDEPPPPLLLIIPFIVSPLLYFWLIQKGRKDQGGEATNSNSSPQATASNQNLQATLLEQQQQQQKKPPKLLSKNEEEQLKSCFSWEFYYLQNLDYGGQAVLCRGKLRTAPDKAYYKIKKNIQEKFGDRFLVIFQESFQGKEPFFALVPNPRTKEKEETRNNDELNKPVLALSLAVITLFTTTVVGATLAGVSQEEAQSDPNLLLEGLPYALSLMWILGCHEFSHYFTAIYYNIRATLPYFIPFPFFLGTLGAFIQMKSPIPHRKALFDVGIAGPIGGFVMTVPLLLWGLSLSEIVSLTDESGLLVVESLDPRSSLLMTVLCKLALGEDFVQGTAIALHPIAIAGYIGVIVTALNLMPVGQLDGGHIVHAMYGQRTAVIIGQISRFLMLILAIIEPSFLIWAILLFFMPIFDEPALNDVSELDQVRDLLGFLSLVLLVSILLPLPATFTEFLNV
ncbi:site-2 protease family protein [Euhalothece natronophila Z-M001]|uniref:Site-2 protease family protein n=1 Tax=Euhalothece natronophila Z-M001 TaxID=522448 RepID=A0A5B8NP26_9CHRO|nr:site-2 protease family protein [Euhalothece natronophila]QDZ39945.1 site-2 protease family protein [Euhalothece natronophila Z-M001]